MSEQQKMISEFEAGMLTEAIKNLTEQFRLLSTAMNDKFSSINEKLSNMSDMYPTRREYDELKINVDKLGDNTRKLQDEAAENRSVNKILWIIISTLVLTGLAAAGIGVYGHGITH